MNASFRQPTPDSGTRFTRHIRLIAGWTAIFLALALVVPSTAAACDSAARKVGRGAANLTLGVLGVWEVLTCPFETPPGFKPILTPEYPWGYFSEGQR